MASTTTQRWEAGNMAESSRFGHAEIDDNAIPWLRKGLKRW